MHWRILPLMMVVVAFAHFNRISITVAGAEQIIPSGLISKERMGLVYSALLIVYTLCMIPGGWFLDRFGPRAAWMVLVFGSAGFVTATGLIGWCITDSWHLFIALVLVRGCFGVVCAPLHPTGARLVANWTQPSAHDFANGLINAAALVGIAFTYVVFGLLIDLFGWPIAFMVTGGFTFVLALAWFWLGADRMPGATSGEHELARDVEIRRPFHVIANSSLLFLTLGYGLYGYFQYLFFYWAEYYFENQMELSKETSRWSSTFLTLAMGGGMFAGGWLSDWARHRFTGRWGLAAVPMLALGIAGVATCASLGDFPGWAVIAGLAAAMFSAGICEGSYWSTAVRLGRESGGTAAAIMNTAGNAIGLLAPLLTPWISTRYGWQASLSLAALVCWIAAISWLGVRVDEPADR